MHASEHVRSGTQVIFPGAGRVPSKRCWSAGHEEKRANRLLLHGARRNSITLVGPTAADLLDPAVSSDLERAIRDLLPEVAAAWKGDERNTLLMLARMWVTVETGEIVPKDDAALRIIDRLSARHHDVLRLAIEDYRGERRADWRAWAAEVEAVTAELAGIIERCKVVGRETREAEASAGRAERPNRHREPADSEGAA